MEKTNNNYLTLEVVGDNHKGINIKGLLEPVKLNQAFIAYLSEDQIRLIASSLSVGYLNKRAYQFMGGVIEFEDVILSLVRLEILRYKESDGSKRVYELEQYWAKEEYRLELQRYEEQTIKKAV
jgi:hypothetical protein